MDNNILKLQALKFIASRADDGITMTELIQELRENMKQDLTKDDLKQLKNRNDDSFSQKVRNLISHKTINEFVTKDGDYYKINDCGLKFVEDHDSDYYSADIEQNDDFREENYGDIKDSFEQAAPENVYLSVYDLKRKYDRSLNGSGNLENSLILDPSYQRYDGIWTRKNKSLFIESIILNIPIPSLYLSEDERGNLIVIDGRQRLTTLFDFMNDKFILSGLSILKELNGLKFSKLTGDKEKYKSKIEDRSLHIQKLGSGINNVFIIETFERVNTKGVRLNSQEIRNAMFQGQSTKLLNEISNYYSGDNEIIDKKRMKDKYIILRYFAMKNYYDSLKNGKTVNFYSISDYLSQCMKNINMLSDNEIEEMKDSFIKIYDRSKDIFKSNAFRIKPKLPINMILFEITLIIVANCMQKTNEEIKNVYDKFLNWNIDDNKDSNETTFEKNIKYHRDSKENIEERLNFILNILGE